MLNINVLYMKQHTAIFISGLSGSLAIAAGAFGAHLLEEKLSVEMLQVFKTGASYHLVHSVFALLLAYAGFTGKYSFRTPWILAMSGIILFSFSLYALALSSLQGAALSWLGAITPLGGLCFITAWLLAGWKGYQTKKG
jgi:uncharacterized membrane protein YgdD (TMEM256/DUF423 family)